MIGYFPKPFLDEIFSSLEGRFHSHTLSRSLSQTKTFLFGIREVNTSLYFPVRLGSFIENVNHINSFDFDGLISNQTLWPYFSNFIKKEKHTQILKIMKQGGSTRIASLIGINGSGFFLSETPKYCPLCNEESLKRNGELYWHRTHQIPNITVCSTHNCFLEEYFPSDEVIPKTPIFIPSKENCPVTIPRMNVNDRIFEVAKFMVDILEGRTSLNFDYRGQAKDLGYFKRNAIDQIQLKNDALAFFGDGALKFFFKSEGLKNPIFVTRQLINESHKILNPTRHVLIQYFFRSIGPQPKQEIPFQNLIERHTHTCKNPVCSSYQNQITERVDILYNRKSRTTIGYIKCLCGMIYTHSYKAIGDKNREIIRIKRYGYLWDSKFIELYRAKVPAITLAKKLGIAMLAIDHHAKRLRLLADGVDNSDKVLQELKLKERLKLREEIFQEKMKLKREIFQKFYEDHPGIPFRKRKMEITKVYDWLMTNDRAWIDSNYPKVKIKRNQKSDRRISMLDEGYLEKLRLAHRELLVENSPKRISKERILNRANIKIRHLDLPKCRSFLDLNQESIEACQIRRLGITANKLSSQGEKITAGRLLFDSHIWKRTDRLITMAQELALN